MIKGLQKFKPNSINHNKRFPNITDYLCDQYCGLYIEEYFNDVLALERKRTERSKKPFLLMLLNIEKILNKDDKSEIVRKIAQVLLSGTRETDIKGWFRYDAIIGVIFTEMGNIDKNFIRQKIFQYLCSLFKQEQVKNIEISFYSFPSENGKQDFGDSIEKSFYSDISKRNRSQRISLFIKRIVDIIGSIVFLIISSPLFLMISLCIKVTSAGPILFRQERVGQSEKKFTFLKFRTMYNDSDPTIHEEYIKQLIHEQKTYSVKNGDKVHTAIYKIDDDPRVTPLGRILRKTSLDELPQFINVLTGQMSLVGPRPPIPYELQNYDIWHRRRIFGIKPGITGLWQVRGRSTTTFDEMVRMDIRYIRDWSLWFDMKILFRTPWVVLTGKGAY